ncbi:MAG: hypothetical protein HC880_03775 [Bacteroidia bacterium]|nr:hypothetical protein [Bacteroidia bacterium]
MLLTRRARKASYRLNIWLAKPLNSAGQQPIAVRLKIIAAARLCRVATIMRPQAEGREEDEKVKTFQV